METNRPGKLFYLQSLLNCCNNFVQSDEDILDVLAPGCRDKLQMVLLVDPEEKVIIVVFYLNGPCLGAALKQTLTELICQNEKMGNQPGAIAI